MKTPWIHPSLKCECWFEACLSSGVTSYFENFQLLSVIRHMFTRLNTIVQKNVLEFEVRVNNLLFSAAVLHAALRAMDA